MSNDGPTLNDDSFAGPVGPGPVTCHSHGNGPSHTHPADPGPARPRTQAPATGETGSDGRPRLRPSRPPRRGGRLRHHPPGRIPAGGAVADGRRQAAGRRAARPPRGDLHRRRMARGQSQGRRVLRPGPGRALAGPGPPWWRSGPPGGPACGPKTTRPSATWSTPRPRRCASWPSRRRCTWSMPCAPPWTRRWPWWPTRWSSSGPTISGCSSMPSTSSTGTRPTPNSPCASSGPPKRPGPRPWSSATPTGVPLPYEVERIVADVLGRLRDPGRCPLPQ